VSSNPAHSEVYSIKHYVIKFVSDLPKFGGLQNALQQKCTAIKNIFNISDIKCKSNIFDLTLKVVNYCRNLINMHCYVKPILIYTLVQNKLIYRSLPLVKLIIIPIWRQSACITTAGYLYMQKCTNWEQDELQQSFANINIIRFRICMHCKVFSIYVFSQLKWGVIVLFIQLHQWTCWPSLFKLSGWMLNIEKVSCKNYNMSHSH
jgi:hypothetical protein